MSLCDMKPVVYEKSTLLVWVTFFLLCVSSIWEHMYLMMEKAMEFPLYVYGVIGHPLAHSMSPALHNWGFREISFPGMYMAWPKRAEELSSFFAGVRALPVQGGNITLPHKVAAMAYMDVVSERAQKVGAINTFYWDNGLLIGDNTDVEGFLAPLTGKHFHTALLLGAGGVGRAVLTALADVGVRNTIITNRTDIRAQQLAQEFKTEYIEWERRGEVAADLIINATSMGMHGEQEDMTPYPANAFKGRGLAYDIVYTPMTTRFLREAATAGWEVQNGVAMFVAQARASFRLWTAGREMPQEGAADKVITLLQKRSAIPNIKNSAISKK